MRKFKTLVSTSVIIPYDNIDTDQIIPSRFLKQMHKNLGQNLFLDWKKQHKNFTLDKKQFYGEIMIVGNNFGCGSSREHAVWAILDYGIKVILSNSFADIFIENSLNNGLLAIEISNKFLKYLIKKIYSNKNTKIKVNLIKQYVALEDMNKYEKFHINPYKKKCFINGYDDIDFILSIKKEIENFENNTILI